MNNPKVLTSRLRLKVQRPIWRVQSQWLHSKSSSIPSTSHLSEDQSLPIPMPLRAMPGPPMLENIARYLREGFRYHHLFIEETFERYGPIFRHALPGATTVYISDPDDIEKVYRRQGFPSSRGEFLGVTHYRRENNFPEGISGQDPESWLVHRNAVAPKMLLRGAFQPFLSELVNVADDTIAAFKEGRNENLIEHLRKWAAENIGVVVFGQRIGINGASPTPIAIEFIESVHGYFTAEAHFILSAPLHNYLPINTPTLKKIYRHIDKQIEIFRYFLEETKKQPSPLTSYSLVERLATEDNLPEEDIVQICESIFSGGVHTTSGHMLVMCYFLSKNPEVQREMYEEIRRVLPENQEPTYEKLAEMPYLRAFLKEASRYQPSPPGTVRCLDVPVVLRGYHIPPGIRIVLSYIAPKSIQRKTFGDFEKFCPGRWLPNNPKKVHPFASVPFGFGPRSCIGKRLVDLETSIYLIRLLQKYEIFDSKLKEDQVKWYFNLIFETSKPYALNLKKRN